jgi:hypothetical protein
MLKRRQSIRHGVPLRKHTQVLICTVKVLGICLFFIVVNNDGGGVSERPKERASKARVGETQPWVQIPPPPPRIHLASNHFCGG